MKPGFLKDRILVATAGAENLVFEIPVEGEVVSEMVIEPAEVVLVVSEQCGPQETSIRISRWDQQEFVVGRVTTDIEGLRVNHAGALPQRTHTVRVEYVSGAKRQKAANIKGSLHVHVGGSSDVLEIPAYIMLGTCARSTIEDQPSL